MGKNKNVMTLEEFKEKTTESEEQKSVTSLRKVMKHLKLVL